MENMATYVICSLLAALLMSCPPTLAQEPENDSEFSYDEKSNNGPSHWGDIRPEWFMCKNGRMQSPIDLEDRTALIAPVIQHQTSYHSSIATLKNRGHDIMLSWAGGAGYLQVGGTQFILQQCHWHSPSEHAINGRKFDLEIHLVHQSADGRFVVIAMLYKIGAADAFLTSLINDLRAVHNTTGAERAVGSVDPNSIGIQHQNYYIYKGSLTTPPCQENVYWVVIKEERTASREQVNLLRVDKSGGNARPLQPLNNRIVLLHPPTV